ncbi:thiamine phosphate synthase [Sulfurimonas sp.]|uniref:thiamine phosphate synthase n=1 Tax=Sulfurimonas sp. TaxID=2022749 RepID=UPI003567831B
MKSYMITSDALSSEHIKKHMPDYVLYRDKTNQNYADDASKFVDVCRRFKGVKSFLHQDADLAKKLGANGVHLTSLQLDKVEYAKSKNLEVIISTHSLEEVQKAEILGADAVTYSPVFNTPNKGEPKGVDDLKVLVECVDIKVFALGGITSQKEIDKIKDTGVYGFASIRYFE